MRLGEKIWLLELKKINEPQNKLNTTTILTNTVIQKRESQITALDELTETIFLKMFGFNQNYTAKISDVAEVIGGLQVSSKRKSNPIEVPYLRVANVLMGKLLLDEIKIINVTEKELERSLLKKKDLLIVEGHGNKKEVGRAAIWNGEIENCVHQNHLIKVRVFDNNIYPEYLCAYLNSIEGRKQMFRNSNTTSGLNTISTNVVRNTKIFIPSLKEQEIYINLVSNVNKQRELLKRNLIYLNNLNNSLLQKAFKGELFQE